MLIYDLSYSDIIDIINKESKNDLSPLNISILRNVMLEPIEVYWRFLALKQGFRANICFGEYNNIYQEAVGGRDDLLNEQTDCVCVFMRLEEVSWDLSRNFSALSTAKIEEEKQRIATLISNVLGGIRQQTSTMILWHGFELPVYSGMGIIDSQSESYQLGTINDLNRIIREKLSEIGNAYFIDLNLCLARLGFKAFYDQRYWHIGRAPYSRDAYREIAVEDFKFIKSLKGKNKKCLVLDCDNTLWGGIVGEDGLPGIKIGKTYPGSAYYEFQQEILNLYNRGIIIALCSKNNESDAMDVFRRHPEMLLREEHIATYQINWNDKAANIRLIAQDLNLGLDSLVFVDDSEFETNMIRQVLPEVETIHLPKGKAVEYRDMLASCGYFDTLTFSLEDKKRGEMYKAEFARKTMATEFTDLNSYYKSLEMVITVRLADSFSIPRIAQLTQKTNQFNLTTKRYSEEDIKSFVENPDIDVLYLQLQDKFGDSGIVGVAIVKYECGSAVIDTFLLSCRVLGREVEDVFLARCLELAKSRETKIIKGSYFATAKNAQVRDFYEKRGFKICAQDESTRLLEYDLDAGLFDEPDFFKGIIFEAV